jgi:hypothetical protein
MTTSKADGLPFERVIDRQAETELKTCEHEVGIAGRSYQRRLVGAKTVISLVQECGRSIARDSWETEGDATTADDSWTAVFFWHGDRKSSSSTWWNTGNPRPLVELQVFDAGSTGIPSSDALHRWLGSLFRRAEYVDPHQPVSPWYEVGRLQVAEAIRSFAPQSASPGTIGPSERPPVSDLSLTYLLREECTNWIKIGKCEGSRSPAERRRSMYQPGNRRELKVVAQWPYVGRCPETAMKATLKRNARASGAGFRSEWFELGVERALGALRDDKLI